MQITNLEVQKRDKNRFNVYIENRYYCALTASTIVKNKIKVGLDVEEEYLQNLQFETEKETALNKAITFIAKTYKTQKQVEKYLKNKGYLENVIAFVLEKLQEYHFVDDQIFMESYIKQNSITKGKRRINFELMQKGVDEKAVKLRLSQIENEEENIFNLSQKYMQNKTKDLKTKQRLYNFLIYRGFDSSQIVGVLNKIFNDEQL